MSSSQATLIYDGECPLCRKAVAWVEGRVRGGALYSVACQDPERAVRCPQVDEAACMEAMQLVLSDGSVYAGEEALPHLFRMMGRWRWFAIVFSIPGVSLLAPGAYRWIASHRHMFSIIVARKEGDAGDG